MTFRHVPAIALLALGGWAAIVQATWAQQPPTRSFAPGVVTVIPGKPEEAETTSEPAPLKSVDSLANPWQPNYAPVTETLEALAKDVILRRPVWQLEFSFKPMNMIEVDVPAAGGRIARQSVWYLVYQVRNRGNHLNPKPVKDKFGHDLFTAERVNMPVRFFPLFTLESHDATATSDGSMNKPLAYSDRVLPSAIRQIHAIEIKDPRIPLHDSVSISSQQLEVSTDEEDRALWGVATWLGVDPRTDFLSVYVQGLSNAYREEAGVNGAPDQILAKTLKLNFWRPGDEIDATRPEFHFGIPLVQDPAEQERLLRAYSVDERTDFQWVYRP
ncbi:MAG: hypothetical protein R3E01_11505 [Pirellulaceae bacterium]|nr:hypothetical protein [Planctomycetales bacterium]